MLRRSLGVAAAVLLLPAAADGHGFRSLFQPTVTTYYYPAPVVYVPVVPAVAHPCPVPVMPSVAVPIVPARPTVPLAQPQPAPPSPEPPLATPQPPAPEVRESRYHDAYSVAGREAARPSADGRCSVRFWNLSGRDLVLAAGGRRVVLPHGKSTTLELERHFVWQIEGRPALVEQVPAGESAREIVIRR